jgi:peroxisome-assembly ATPase
LGTCARFTFHDLCGLPLGSADYLELCRRYTAFIVTDVPKMSFREKDLARRFIVFIDAVYESKAKIVITSEIPIAEIFTGEDPLKLEQQSEGDHTHLDSGLRSLMDDLGVSMDILLKSSIFVWFFEVYLTIDWRRREVCFCKGIVTISTDGK